MSISEISMTVIQAVSQPASQPANKLHLYTILQNNDSSYQINVCLSSLRVKYQWSLE